MEKNSFLIYNDIVYVLYTCKTFEDIRDVFLPRLRMLVPFSYASFLIADNSHSNNNIFRKGPLCFPTSFTPAEEEYLNHYEDDHMLWLIHGNESALVRESELLPEDKRLASQLYKQCYEPFGVYDQLQYSAVYSQLFLGAVTLFRTRDQGEFNEEDAFYIRTLGAHINIVINRIYQDDVNPEKTGPEHDIPGIARDYGLTVRETEILTLLYQYRSNAEISETLNIKENTLQKHMQNIFRKMDVSSRWELLRF